MAPVLYIIGAHAMISQQLYRVRVAMATGNGIETKDSVGKCTFIFQFWGENVFHFAWCENERRCNLQCIAGTSEILLAVNASAAALVYVTVQCSRISAHLCWDLLSRPPHFCVSYARRDRKINRLACIFRGCCVASAMVGFDCCKHSSVVRAFLTLSVFGNKLVWSDILFMQDKCTSYVIASYVWIGYVLDSSKMYLGASGSILTVPILVQNRSLFEARLQVFCSIRKRLWHCLICLRTITTWMRFSVRFINTRNCLLKCCFAPWASDNMPPPPLTPAQEAALETAQSDVGKLLPQPLRP